MEYFQFLTTEKTLVSPASSNVIVWLFLDVSGTVEMGGKEFEVTAGDTIMQFTDQTAVFRFRKEGHLGRVEYDNHSRVQKHIQLHAPDSEILFQVFRFALNLQMLVTRKTPGIKNGAAIHEALEDLLQLYLDMQSVCGLDTVSSDPVVEAFCIYMEEHFTDPDYDLEAEIRKTGYSSGYFRKRFLQETGRTPLDHLRMRRIMTATSTPAAITAMNGRWATP